MPTMLALRRAELVGTFERTARSYRAAMKAWNDHVCYGDAHGELSAIRALSEKLRNVAEAIVALDREPAAGVTH
jgi:hypothetical protein